MQTSFRKSSNRISQLKHYNQASVSFFEFFLEKPIAFSLIRWLLGFRKLRSSKKVEILQVVLVLQVPS